MNTTYITPAIPTTAPALAPRAWLEAPLTLARRALDTVLMWQERERQRRQLMSLDARILTDMGMSRADAVAEYDKPFWRS